MMCTTGQVWPSLHVWITSTIFGHLGCMAVVYITRPQVQEMFPIWIKTSACFFIIILQICPWRVSLGWSSWMVVSFPGSPSFSLESLGMRLRLW